MASKGDAKEKVRSKKAESKKEGSKAEKSHKSKKEGSRAKRSDGKEKSARLKSDASRRAGARSSQAEEEARERRDAAATAKKRKAEGGAPKEKKKKSRKEKEPAKSQAAPDGPSEAAVEDDRRRQQGGAADTKKKAQDNENGQSGPSKGKDKEPTKNGAGAGAKPTGACAAEAMDGELQAGGSSGSRLPASKSRSPKAEAAKASKPKAQGRSGSDHSVSDYDSESATSGARRRKRREEAGLKAATGFGLAPPPPVPADAGMPAMYGPSSLVPLPDKVKGLLEHKDSLAQEVLRMKMAVEAATGQPSMKVEGKEEPAETTLKMPTRLTECLMDPANHAKLLTKTGLLSATLNEERHLVLRAPTPQRLKKTLGHLRRIAWACQWGCSSAKVFALLAERPAKPLNSIVLRLAATSSRLSSHDAKLSAKMRKLRMGTQAGPGMLVLEGITGLSRKHCTITFEPDKGACYVQDVSTNGTYLNGKRLPRPPYKNPSDARVRLFHGDELLFKLRSEDAEELGYVINLVELS